MNIQGGGWSNANDNATRFQCQERRFQPRRHERLTRRRHQSCIRAIQPFVLNVRNLLAWFLTFFFPGRITSPRTKEASRLGEESFPLIASNFLLREFERGRGLIEEVVVVASHRGSCSFLTRPGFRAAGGKWKGFRHLHVDLCWRVILDATNSSISCLCACFFSFCLVFEVLAFLAFLTVLKRFFNGLESRFEVSVFAGATCPLVVV